MIPKAFGNMKVKRLGSIDYWLGLVLPLPIFIDITSPVLLASSKIAEGGVAFPLSLCVLPVSLYLSFARVSWAASRMMTVYSMLALFFVLTVMALGMLSFPLSSSSILYSFQWSLPFLWLPYFATVVNSGKRFLLFGGIYTGVCLGVAYIFFSGMLEIFLYGSLLDFGRMTQNHIFYGQYQIAVYTPTAIAYGVLIVNWLYKSSHISSSFNAMVALNIMAFFAILFTGAREATLVYLTGMVLYFCVGSLKRVVLFLSVVSFTALIVIVNMPSITAFAESHEVRVLTKFLAMREEGQALGARDTMMLEFFKIIYHSPLWGTVMLPPNEVYGHLNIEAPSAHNYYVDVLAWGGIVSAVFLYSFILLFFFKSIFCIWKCYFKEKSLPFFYNERMLMVGIACCAIVFLLVSNNINVPARQPLTAPIVSFFIGYLCYKRSVGYVPKT